MHGIKCELKVINKQRGPSPHSAIVIQHLKYLPIGINPPEAIYFKCSSTAKLMAMSPTIGAALLP